MVHEPLLQAEYAEQSQCVLLGGGGGGSLVKLVPLDPPQPDLCSVDFTAFNWLASPTHTSIRSPATKLRY